MRTFDKGQYADITGGVIGAAMEVINALKPGLDEKVYENAMVVELGERGLSVDQQRQYRVVYKGHDVGLLIPDLLVEGKVVVDTKVVERFNAAHRAQMIGYLSISGLPVGLLVNFKHAELKWERIVGPSHSKQ